MGRPHNEPDTTMTKIKQVPDSRCHTCAVIRKYCAGAQPPGEIAINHDNRNFPSQEGIYRRFAAFVRRQENQAIDVATMPKADMLGLFPAFVFSFEWFISIHPNSMHRVAAPSRHECHCSPGTTSTPRRSPTAATSPS